MSITDLKTRLAGIAVQAAAPAATADGQVAPAAPAVVETERAARGYVLDVTVPPERVVDAARAMDEAKFALEAITGVDWIAEKQFEVVYDYTLFATGERVVIRTRVPREKPELSTICAIYAGANWHEREAHDFFDLVFAGHPDLSPLLLPEDATFHPLRKDFGA